MTRFKIAGVVAGGLVLVLALSGCGRSDTPTGEASAGATIADSPATGTISVWAMGTEGELLPELVKEFEEANPDATVQVTAVPWQDYAKKVETAVASGSTPDATMVGSSDLAGFAAAGGLDVVPEGLVDTDSFFPGATSAADFNGTAYAVPFYVETRSLFFRKDLAEAAGRSAPTTWEELTEFGKALQAEGATWGASLPTGAPYSWQGVLPFMWQAGAKLTNEDNTQFTIDTPEALEGLTQYQSLIVDGIASANGPVALGELEPKFIANEVGSFVSGPWEMGLLTQAGGEAFVDDSVGLAVLPSGPVDNASYIGGGHFAVFKDAGNRDGAWKFVRWLSEETTQQEWFDISGDLPAVESAWDGGSLSDNAFLQVFRDQLGTAQPAPAVTTWVQVSAAIDAEIEKVAKGVSTPEDALAAMQAAADKIGTGN